MRFRVAVATVVLLLITAAAFAQDAPKAEPSAQEKAMMDAWMKFMTPGEAHKKLDAMVGTFEAKVTMWMAPGAPPQTSPGVSENRWVLGSRYVEQNFSGTFTGMPFSGIGYTGYDNGKKQYFGTWIDNMGTGIMTSTGDTQDGGKNYAFKATSTDPMTGKDSISEEKVTVVDNDHHSMEMWGPGPDGKMFKMMEITYTRKK